MWKFYVFTATVGVVCWLGGQIISPARAVPAPAPVLSFDKYILEDSSGHKVNIMTWTEDGVKCTSTTSYRGGKAAIALSCR